MDKKDPAVVDFVDKLKSQKELQEYAKSQFIALLQANKKIESLEAEVVSLKSALQATQDQSSTSVIRKSNEELTCEMEIAKLYQRSMMMELEMEDVRKLEILTKTLYAAKAKAREDAEAASRPVDLDESELLKLAALPDGSNGGG